MIIRFVNSGLFTISGLFVVSLLFAPAQLPQLTYMNLPAYAANDTKAKFEELATTWAEHCSKHAMSSSTHTYLYPPQVKAIVALGPSVIPLIMTRYGNDACPWGFVLQDITGLKMIEDPDHFSPAQMQRDFSSWYEILMRGGAFACLKNGQIEGLNRAPKPFGGCSACMPICRSTASTSPL